MFKLHKQSNVDVNVVVVFLTFRKTADAATEDSLVEKPFQTNEFTQDHLPIDIAPPPPPPPEEETEHHVGSEQSDDISDVRVQCAYPEPNLSIGPRLPSVLGSTDSVGETDTRPFLPLSLRKSNIKKLKRHYDDDEDVIGVKEKVFMRNETSTDSLMFLPKLEPKLEMHKKIKPSKKKLPAFVGAILPEVLTISSPGEKAEAVEMTSNTESCSAHQLGHDNDLRDPTLPVEGPKMPVELEQTMQQEFSTDSNVLTKDNVENGPFPTENSSGEVYGPHLPGSESVSQIYGPQLPHMMSPCEIHGVESTVEKSCSPDLGEELAAIQHQPTGFSEAGREEKPVAEEESEFGEEELERQLLENLVCRESLNFLSNLNF